MIRSLLALFAVLFLCYAPIPSVTPQASAADDTLTVKSVLDSGKDQIDAGKSSLVVIIKIVIVIGGLIGIGTVFFSAANKFSVQNFVIAGGIIIAVVIGIAIVDKLSKVSTAAASHRIEMRVPTDLVPV